MFANPSLAARVAASEATVVTPTTAVTSSTTENDQREENETAADEGAVQRLRDLSKDLIHKFLEYFEFVIHFML